MIKKLLHQNKIYIIVSVTILIIMLICTIFETNILNNIYKYLFDINYRNNIMNINNNYNFIIGFINIVTETWNNFKWHFDYIIIWATNIFQLSLPFFTITGSIIYIKQNREQNIKKIIFESLKISLSIFFAFLIFYIFIMIVCKGNYSDYITRELFVDMLGNNFYFNHIYLYYLIEGIIKFLIMPFIYISSGIFLSLSFKNNNLVYYYFIIIYFFMAMISTLSVYLINPNLIYFSPLTIMIASSYNNISISLLVMINLLPIIISLFIFRRIKNER